ncbi:hypothetical protein E5K51_03480 [Helicobacter pylori]|nr:hypothetical protein E5K51_03480 [Helicobacter pylori]
MRQKNETAINFNELKEITQAIQALKHKGSVQAKKSALKPTKRAFSERQRTRIGDNSQASAKESQRRR